MIRPSEMTYFETNTLSGDVLIPLSPKSHLRLQLLANTGVEKVDSKKRNYLMELV